MSLGLQFAKFQRDLTTFSSRVNHYVFSIIKTKAQNVKDIKEMKWVAYVRRVLSRMFE